VEPFGAAVVAALMPDQPQTRRSFLARSALLGTSALLPLGPAFGREIRGGEGMPWAEGAADPPFRLLNEGGFLTDDERRAVDAIAARLIPSDENGSGAREADVLTFIDRQLAGFYGRAERWYMEGPFPDDYEDTQGYQTPHTPAALWREGLAALDAHCRATHDDRGFAELDEAEQDAVLTGLDEEEIAFEGLSAKTFFDFAREMTIEGFFCDPIYGGNRDMVGWRAVGFPGARYDYRPFIDHGGRPIDIAPVGLAGGPRWRVDEGEDSP
jgi:gluconate 2-dehydrogenase gamma chain